jgi:hypothetical protein
LGALSFAALNCCRDDRDMTSHQCLTTASGLDAPDRALPGERWAQRPCQSGGLDESLLSQASAADYHKCLCSTDLSAGISRRVIAVCGSLPVVPVQTSRSRPQRSHFEPCRWPLWSNRN